MITVGLGVTIAGVISVVGIVVGVGVGVIAQVGTWWTCSPMPQAFILLNTLTQHGDHFMDDLRVSVVPMASVSLLCHGPVETIINVEFTAPDIGACYQETMVEFPLAQQNHQLCNHLDPLFYGACDSTIGVAILDVV